MALVRHLVDVDSKSEAKGIRPLIPQISPVALGVRCLMIFSSVEEFSVHSLDVIVNDGF